MMVTRRTRSVLWIRMAVSSGVLLTTLTAATQAAPPIFFANDCIPPLTGTYLSENSTTTWQSYTGSGITALLRNPMHSSFSSCLAPPGPGGQTTHTFNSVVYGEVSLTGGTSWFPMIAPAIATVVVRWNSQIGDTRYFDCELTQLDIVGGTMPPGMRIRERPTRQSLGTASITDVPGGYLMESSFDVWTDLTINNGGFWHPSTISGKLILVGPPAPAGAVSRKTHGAAGDFDIDLLAANNTENRNGGPTRIIVTFDRDVQGIGGLDPGDVAVSSGTISSVSLLTRVLTIHLSGANQLDVLNVQFPGIADMAGNPVADNLCFPVLLGDRNGDGTVNIFDYVIMRNDLNAGQPVGSANARSDINTDGVINVYDLILGRTYLNQTVMGVCP